MKEISIILVTFNSSFYIEPCLESVFNQGFKDYELTIIDNASTDNTKRIIKTKYPGTVLIENSNNFGPCYARNMGIAKTNSKFVLCLDHDVKLRSNFLENIYNVIKSQDNLGAVGPKILMADADTIYSAGIYFSYLWRFHDIGSGKKDSFEFGKEKYVFGVSACAAIYRREALEQIKQGQEYFDEDFFHLFDDVDISWRIQKKGWRILYSPKAACLHEGGRSRKKDRISQYLCMRNRYLLILKNESLFSMLRFFIVFFIYDLWRNLFMLVINPGYFLKGVFEISRLLPKMLKKRY